MPTVHAVTRPPALRFGGLSAGLRRVSACGVAAVLSWSALADTLRLTNGASIEGTLLSEDADGYRVRTVSGILNVPREIVASVDDGKAGTAEYEKRRDAAADTVEGQLALAEWCGGSGRSAAAVRHYERVIELDPHHAAARAALGYVRVGDLWVEARTAYEKPEAQPQRRPLKQVDEDKLLAAIRTQWTTRIRAIRAQLLDSSNADWIKTGRERILAIDDPLAIAPLALGLSEGGVAARRVLIESLARFSQDESTLNLASLALLDADETVRRAALSVLLKRDDPRVVAQFRKALQSDNDELIRRAAVGLGVLKSRAAVPELIDCLKAQRRRTIEVPIQTYFGEFSNSFNTATSVSFGGGSMVLSSQPQLAVAGRVNPTIFNQTKLEKREVTVFRTEVLDALRQITGQGFGFDESEWRRWHQEQTP